MSNEPKSPKQINAHNNRRLLLTASTRRLYYVLLRYQNQAYAPLATAYY